MTKSDANRDDALTSLSSLKPKTFTVLGVQQIAIGGNSKRELAELWQGLLGLEKIGDYRSESENVDEDILVAGHGPLRIEVDLMEPIDPDKRPRVHSPALNHVGLWVDDIDNAVSELEAKGVRFTPGGVRLGAAGHRVCFIHPRGSEEKPRSGLGVLIELVEAPTSVAEAFDRARNEHAAGKRGEGADDD